MGNVFSINNEQKEITWKFQQFIPTILALSKTLCYNTP